MIQPDRSFEALIYSTNRTLAVRCADALAKLPIDWIMLDDSRRALQCAGDRRFDFILLDIDSPQGASILTSLSSAEGSSCVVLALTEQPIDPDILEMCYKSQFFYPVRPDQLAEQLSCSLPLAERLAAHHAPKPAAEEEEVIHVEAYSEPRLRTAFAVAASLAMVLVTLALRFAAGLLRMEHSLSTVWQERVASGISALGSIWLVEDVTKDFAGFQHLGPPPVGPIYLVATAMLLWLCAKHRRVSDSMRSSDSLVAV